MGDGERAAKPSDRQGPLPGFPLRPRLQWMTLIFLVAAIAVDGYWLDGAVFASGIWHSALWIIAAAGLALGGYAQWRRGG